MRRKYSATVRDRSGNIIAGASILVYLAGTTTPADVYANLDAAVTAHGVASDEAGRYTFYVDTFDYGFDQTFKIVCTRGIATVTVDNITIEDIVLGAYAVTANRTVTTNIHVPKGVTYTVTTGVTLTFSGSFSAGLYRVFTGEGAVLFGSGAVKEVAAAWFGNGVEAEAKARTAIASMTWPTVYERVTIFYGTGDAPDAATVPEGSLYLQFAP
jgi:hypothetical protein